jgi:hypothetical protein
MRPDGRQRDDLPGRETVERRYAPRYPLWVDSPVERPPSVTPLHACRWPS